MPVQGRRGVVGRLKTSLGSGSTSFNLKRENRNIIKALNLYPIDGSDLYGASMGSILYVSFIRIVEVLIYTALQYFLARVLGRIILPPDVLVSSFLFGFVFSALLVWVQSYFYGRVMRMEKKTAAYIILQSLPHILSIKVILLILGYTVPPQVSSLLNWVGLIASSIIVGYLQSICVNNLEIGSRSERDEMIKHLVMTIGELLLVLTAMYLLYIDIAPSSILSH